MITAPHEILRHKTYPPNHTHHKTDCIPVVGYVSNAKSHDLRSQAFPHSEREPFVMYNGIGVQTPRGTGTNGYVQRNFAFIRHRKEKVDYKTEEDIAKLERTLQKKPNKEILEHQWKRNIELKCLELRDELEEQG